jgi:hypothetical protein
MKSFNEWKQDQVKEDVSNSIVVLILFLIMFIAAALAA